MTNDIAALDVPLAEVKRNIARQQTEASADRLRWLLAEQTHQLDPADRAFADLACNCPATACSCDADYAGWAEHIAALQAANRTTRKEGSS